MEQVVRKKAAGTSIHALEITHRLLTRHTKGLVLVAKVSGRSREGLGSREERKREEGLVIWGGGAVQG